MFWHVGRSGASKAKRVSILAVVAAAAAMVGGISAISSTPVAGGAATSSPLGVYTGALSPGSTAAFGRAIGQQPTYAMDFLDGTSWSTIVNGASSYMSTWSGSGYTMVWGVPMLPGSFSPNSNPADTSGSAYGLQQGASGAYNSYFLKLAQEMVAGGQGSSIVRPGWEFNGNWFPWSANGQAAAYVGYWQQIVTTMRSVSGQDFKFEWNPTAGDEGVGDLANYYPGNAYVDYIGLDVYDQTWGTYAGIASEWNTYLTQPYGLDWLASFAAAQGKTITLPEWGLDPSPSSNDGGPVSQPGSQVGGGDDPTFINDMAQWISQNNVVDAGYWDYNSSKLSSSSNPNSYAAFVNDFGAGSSFTPPTTTTTTASPTTTTTTSPTGDQTFSTVKIKQSSARVVTSKEAQFTAVVRTLPSRAKGPAGPVTWTVTSRHGTAVPCAVSNAGRDPANGHTTCTVPSGQLAAADGPYTVSVRYGGGGNIAPSVATVERSVAKASSQSAVQLTPTLSGGHLQVTAVVQGSSAATAATTPTGRVSFAVWGGPKKFIPCRAGNTASLSSGQATCHLANTSPDHALYIVKVSYSGDGNFNASSSKMRAVTVQAQSVSFLYKPHLSLALFWSQPH
jgi:hypothetical protein